MADEPGPSLRFEIRYFNNFPSPALATPDPQMARWFPASCPETGSPYRPAQARRAASLAAARANIPGATEDCPESAGSRPLIPPLPSRDSVSKHPEPSLLTLG